MAGHDTCKIDNNVIHDQVVLSGQFPAIPGTPVFFCKNTIQVKPSGLFIAQKGENTPSDPSSTLA